MFLIQPEYYQVKKVPKKGLGVLVKKDIPAGTVIGDYLGRVLKDAEAEKLEEKYGQGCYSFDYGPNLSVFPEDIKATGVHLINHSCSPNCAVASYQDRNICFALRQIFAGEELSVDYRFDPESVGAVSYCFCDSPFCRGTMYARVEKSTIGLKKPAVKVARKEKIKRVKAGGLLRPLLKYPRIIKDQKPYYGVYANLKVSPLICPETKLPATKIIRERISQSGRALVFPKLKLRVLGVVDGCLLAER